MNQFVILFALLLPIVSIAQDVETEADTTVRTTQVEQRSDGLVYLHSSEYPLTGKVEGVYPNGELKFERNYVDGQLNGLETFWYENGQKKEQGNIVNGKPNGPGITWYANGQKKAELNVVNGQFDGRISGWYRNGQREYVRNYVAGRRIGLEITWHENGQKKLERAYGTGGYDGLVTEWYDSGQKKSEANYIDGKQDGVRSAWYRDGQEKPLAAPSSGERDFIQTTPSDEGRAVDRVNISAVIRPTPYFEYGEMMGYRVYPGTDRKQFVELGLRPGDLLTKIDGIPLVDPQRAMQEFEKLGDAEPVPVTVERDGLPEELVLRLRGKNEND